MRLFKLFRSTSTRFNSSLPKIGCSANSALQLKYAITAVTDEKRAAHFSRLPSYLKYAILYKNNVKEKIDDQEVNLIRSSAIYQVITANIKVCPKQLMYLTSRLIQLDSFIAENNAILVPPPNAGSSVDTEAMLELTTDKIKVLLQTLPAQYSIHYLYQQLATLEKPVDNQPLTVKQTLTHS